VIVSDKMYPKEPGLCAVKSSVAEPRHFDAAAPDPATEGKIICGSDSGSTCSFGFVLLSPLSRALMT
jgi:hypothetical protein